MIEQYKKHIIGVFLVVSVGGIAAAADNRWLQKSSFEAWLESDRRHEIHAEIRQLDRQINRAESDQSLSDDPVEQAVLEERITLLEEQRADLERELE